jgi:alkylated DNA nucleotide flippase Atl1
MMAVIEIYPTPRSRDLQAHQIWSILAAWICLKCQGKMGKGGLITYGELAEFMGYPTKAGRTLGVALGKIREACDEFGLPHLNVIVVDQETGQPGDGILIEDPEEVAAMQTRVFKEDWFSFRHPPVRAFR